MGKYSIGIDLGGTKILTSIVDKQQGEIVASVKKKTKKEKGIQKIIQNIICSVNDVLSETNMDIKQIDNIGIGIAAQVDRKRGIIINAPNIDCKDVNIKEILENEFKKTVFVGNDVETATIGELYFGSGKSEKDFICVFIGTGIGSGIVQDGRIRLGKTGTSGEIGHIIIDKDGRLCNCGNCGCLEAYASRLAIEKRILGLLKQGRKSDIENYLKPDKHIKSNMIKKSIENNDELIIQIINEASDYLASGLAGIVNFYNPSLIILGGGLINAVNYLYEKTTELTKTKCLNIPAKELNFKKAKLGDFSGVIGASLLEEYRNQFSL